MNENTFYSYGPKVKLLYSNLQYRPILTGDPPRTHNRIGLGFGGSAGLYTSLKGRTKLSVSISADLIESSVLFRKIDNKGVDQFRRSSTHVDAIIIPKRIYLTIGIGLSNIKVKQNRRR